MSDDQYNRPPIDRTVATAVPDPRWRVELVEESTSTNADVADRFRAGEGEGLVLAAENQTAGRGRLGREWVTPPQASLTVSFLLVPHQVPAERWPWLPLLTGVAAATAVRRVTGVQVDLKWPNDVLSDGLKLGGILLERVEPREPGGDAAAVGGIGMNCAQSVDELPVPSATSLAILTGHPVDRAALLVALVRELAETYDAWRSGADLRPRYLDLCVTPGQDVTVAVPGGRTGAEITGQAVDVDSGGRLVVRTSSGDRALGAGDVVHVRPAGS